MSTILKYPLQRIESISDYLKISVVTYEAPGLGSAGAGAGRRGSGGESGSGGRGGSAADPAAGAHALDAGAR